VVLTVSDNTLRPSASKSCKWSAVTSVRMCIIAVAGFGKTCIVGFFSLSDTDVLMPVW